jgi:hypothetical protein
MNKVDKEVNMLLIEGKQLIWNNNRIIILLNFIKNIFVKVILTFCAINSDKEK